MKLAENMLAALGMLALLLIAIGGSAAKHWAFKQDVREALREESQGAFGPAMPFSRVAIAVEHHPQVAIDTKGFYWSDCSIQVCTGCHDERWNHSATGGQYPHMIWFDHYEKGEHLGRFSQNPDHPAD